MKRTGLLSASLALLLVLVLTLSGCTGNIAANSSNRALPTPESAVPGSVSNSTPETEEPSKLDSSEQEEKMESGTLLYQGHGSLRISTIEGKVIYIDPYAGEGYDAPADLILVTHPHPDHTAIDLIETQNPGCVTITHEEALADGEHKVFDLDYVTVEAVQAGNNPNHDINICVGYILTLSDGKSVYVSGDTSATDQMAELAERDLDYAFFCCDGKFNMDIGEASACAALVQAKHSIPYHMAPGELFNQERAGLFAAEGKLIVAAGEEIMIE